jgi:hypothetical protein
MSFQECCTPSEAAVRLLTSGRDEEGRLRPEEISGYLERVAELASIDFGPWFEREKQANTKRYQAAYEKAVEIFTKGNE